MHLTRIGFIVVVAIK